MGADGGAPGHAGRGWAAAFADDLWSEFSLSQLVQLIALCPKNFPKTTKGLFPTHNHSETLSWRASLVGGWGVDYSGARPGEREAILCWRRAWAISREQNITDLSMDYFDWPLKQWSRYTTGSKMYIKQTVIWLFIQFSIIITIFDCTIPQLTNQNQIIQRVM